MAKGIPDGLNTVTPILNLKDASAAVEFLRQAFGAEVVRRFDSPDGTLGHAALRIGSSAVFVEEAVKNPPTVSSFLLFFEDVDAAWARATAAGAAVQVPLANQFWGARWGLVRDRWGNAWGLATEVEDVSPEEMRKRLEAARSG
jgi:PhnB protein